MIFWEPSTTKSSSLSRARGCQGRRELYSQVTRHHLVSVTAFCIDRCGVTIHTHQVVSQTTTTTTDVYPKRAFSFVCVTCMMDPGGQPSRSAAQRRRERRLRSMLRHERMSVAMALADKLHHPSRGQRMARAGEEESELHYTAKVRKTPPPSRCSSACTKKNLAGGGLPAWQSRWDGTARATPAAHRGAD